MEHSNQAEERSRSKDDLIAEIRGLKRKLSEYEEEMGIDRVEASFSITQKRIREAPKTPPDQPGAPFQQDAHVPQVSSNDDIGSGICGQNVSEITRMLKDSNVKSDDWLNVLRRLVNDLPEEDRPNLPNLVSEIVSNHYSDKRPDVNLDKDGTGLYGIWNGSTVMKFKSRILDSVGFSTYCDITSTSNHYHNFWIDLKIP